MMAAGGCREIEVDRLYAVRLAEAPRAVNWEEGVPLALKAGGGNVHGKKSVLPSIDPETDPIHTSSASCHHGPPVTDPVPLEMRAYYDDENLYLEVRWDDPTADRTPRAWRKGEEGWGVTFHEGDGLALIWSRYPAQFGCQEACHVDDWTVRGGSLVDVRSMYLAEEGAWEEAWVWKASGGTAELLLGKEGFRTTAGESYRSLNSAAAADESLAAEVRRARTFAVGDGPLHGEEGGLLPEGSGTAPAYLWGAGASPPLLTVDGERVKNGWRVLFTRPLDGGEGRQTFRPGEAYRFGIAVFDDTTVNHHIVRDTQFFTLSVPPS